VQRERATSHRVYLLAGCVSLVLAADAGRAAAADSAKLDAALERARSRGSLLLVVLLDSEPSSSGRYASPAELLEAVRPHEHLELRAEDCPEVLTRLSRGCVPRCVLLDGEGREMGRVEGATPARGLAAQVRKLILAAERYPRSREELERDPDAPEALYWCALYRWNRGDEYLAVRLFQRLVEVSAGHAPGDRRGLSSTLLVDALQHLAGQCLKAGRFDDAEGLFRRAAEKAESDDQQAAAVLGLSRSLRRQGRLSDAVSTLESFLASHRGARRDEALFTLGYLCLEQGERKKGLQRFRELLDSYPDGVYRERALRYAKLSPEGSATPHSPAAPEKGSPEPAESRKNGPSRGVEGSQALTTASFSGSNFIVEPVR
jgi:tetratricopeptide (TPR) repeat protein